jgi:hypothetical protein
MSPAHPIPLVPAEIVAGRLQRRVLGSLAENPHIAVVGQSRSGKDYIARHLILGLAKPLSKAVVFDVKPFHHPSTCRVPGCQGRGDQTYCGWGADVGAGCEAPTLPAHLGAGRYRVIVPADYRKARELLEPLIEVGGQLAEVRETHVVFSDTGRITEPQHRGGFNFGGAVSRLMSEGASTGLPVVACATSVAWAESSVKDQTPTKLIGQITGKRATDMVAELAGLPKWARPALDSLPPRHFLYVDHADGGEQALAIVHAR